MAIKIVQGEDFVLEANLKTTIGCKTECFDLTGLTEATAVFKDTNDADISVTFTGGAIVVDGADGGGRLLITLSDTFTAQIKTGTTVSFELEIEKGTDKRIYQFIKVLNVVARL